MAGTRDFAQPSDQELAPVDSGLRAMAAELPANVVMTTSNTPTMSGTPSTEDNSRGSQPALNNNGYRPVPAARPLDEIDTLLADVDSKPLPVKKGPTLIPVGPAAKPAAQQVEPIDVRNTAPRISSPAPAVNMPVKKPKASQAAEDYQTKARDLKVTARNLSLGIAILAMVIVLTRSLMNRILNTRPNEKTILNQIFDYGVPGLLALSLLMSYALIAASTRAKAQAGLKNAALFKQEQSDAKGKRRIDEDAKGKRRIDDEQQEIVRP